jgi:hypothetical protein
VLGDARQLGESQHAVVWNVADVDLACGVAEYRRCVPCR